MAKSERLKAVVDKSKCEGCGLCIAVCPVDAIEIVNNKAIIKDTCIACGACVAVCPNEAIDLQMTVSDLDDKKEK